MRYTNTRLFYFTESVMHDDCEARITVSLSITNLRPAIILLGGLTSHSTHYMSFRRRFYGSDDPTNSVIALKYDG